MPRQLDPEIAKVLKDHGFGPESCWDCHGTWVVYHRVLEQIAAQTDMRFDPPLVLEANGIAKSVALCVTGHFNDKAEWSIGEAAPGNNKNSYPFAMAEKRAKDRVILKLIGLHGLAYSEDEADDFKESARAPTPQQVAEKSKPAPEPKPEPDTFNADTYTSTAIRKIRAFSGTQEELGNWWKAEAYRRRANGLDSTQISILKEAVIAKGGDLAKVAA